MGKMKIQTQAPGPEEIDFEAALQPTISPEAAQDDQDLATAMRTLRNGKLIPTSYPIKEKPAKPARRPKGTKKAKHSTSVRKPKGAKRQPQAQPTSQPTGHKDIYNTLEHTNHDSLIELDTINNIIDLEEKLTEYELKFLELHLVHRLTVPEALRAANFQNIEHLGKTALYDLGGKIRKKYESRVQDKREIFRTVGLGESQVAQNIKQLTESSNEKIKLGANKLAADCLRLTEPPAHSHQGVNIIINCGPEPPGPLPPGHVPPARAVIQGKPVDLEPSKAHQITK